MLQLRPYQGDCLEAIDAHKGIRPLVVLPTGGGKTVVFSHQIARRPGRSLVLVHRDELAEQTIEKLQIIDPDRQVGVVKAERNEVDAQTVVASVQTVSREARLADLLNYGSFRTVVVDEAHHAPARSWRYVLHGVGSMREVGEPGPLTTGYTATPERDGRKLEIWDGPQPVFYRTIREMVLDDYLVWPRGERVNTSADLSKISKSDGDLAAGQLGSELLTSGAIGEIAQAIKAKASDRKGLAFLPTIATAKALAAVLTELGIPAESVDRGTEKNERRAILKRLRTGVTRFVTNCNVLTEGYDDPSIDCIVIARPTVFRGLYLQMVGRGLRPYPGKDDCLVLDVVGATERHDLVSVIDIGMNVVPEQGSAVVPGEAAPEVERPCRLCGRQVAEARWDVKHYHENCLALESGAINLFKTSNLRWLRTHKEDGKGGWCMGLEKGTLVIVPCGNDRYHLVQHGFGKLDFINRAVPLEWAFGIGEDRAKAYGKLTQRSASWLNAPVTTSQLHRLANEGMPEASLARVQTRGQAADLITRLQGRRAVTRLERRSCPR